MEFNQTFRCGNKSYHVIGSSGYFIIRRLDWIERIFIGYARDVAEAMALIRRDARSGQIRAV